MDDLTTQFQTFDASIGMQLANLLPAGWQKTALGYFVEEDPELAAVQIIYLLDGEWKDLMQDSWEDKVDDCALDDLLHKCEELYYFCEKQDMRFSSYTFSMKSSGKYKTSYDYTPISEFTKEIQDKWMAQQLEEE